MKVKVIAGNKDEAKPYPKLMISKERKLIVLFHRPSVGTVLTDDGSSLAHYREGFYTDDWIMSQFKDFHGTVELTQD